MGVFRRLLKQMSIRAFLMGAGSLLLLMLLALSLDNVLASWRTGREVARVELANRLADAIIEATGFEAIERGLTFTALASDRPVDANTVQSIVEMRSKGDESIARAYEMARALSEMDGTNQAIEAALGRAESLREDLRRARTKADANVTSLRGKDYAPGEWSSLVTSFIEANSEVRSVSQAAGEEEAVHEAMRLNVELKNARPDNRQ